MDKQRITGDCDGAVMMKIGQNKTVTPNITLHLPSTQQQNSERLILKISKIQIGICQTNFFNTRIQWIVM